MKIHIEFCEKWNYQPDFDRVSKEIKKMMPNAQILSNTTAPRSGAFEVTIDGKLVLTRKKVFNKPKELILNKEKPRKAGLFFI